MSDFKLEVRCNKDDDFNRIRNVEYSCGCLFDINSTDVHGVDSLNYFSEDIKEYYAICPYCGHINKIDEKLLPDSVKKAADLERLMNPGLYNSYNLLSEQIYMSRISPPYILERTK